MVGRGEGQTGGMWHLRSCASFPSQSPPTSRFQVAWEPGTECEVAASMLDIFHKLPAQAKRFLESQGAERWVLRAGRLDHKILRNA